MPTTHVRLKCACGDQSEHDLRALTAGAHCPACGKPLRIDALDLLDAPMVDRRITDPAPAISHSPGNMIHYATPVRGKSGRSARRLIAASLGLTWGALQLAADAIFLSMTMSVPRIAATILSFAAALFLCTAAITSFFHFSRLQLLVRCFLIAEAISILGAGAVLLSDFSDRPSHAVSRLPVFAASMFAHIAFAVYFWWGIK